MQLAQVMHTPGRTFELRPGQQLPTEVPGTPSSRLIRKYASDLLSISGAYSVQWSASWPEGRLVVADEPAARIAVGLLEPVVDGVPLQVWIKGGGRYEGPDDASAADRIRAIAAMDGVWRRTYSIAGKNQHGSVTMHTVDQAAADRLDPLLRDRFVGGYHSVTGAPLYLRVRWHAGVHA